MIEANMATSLREESNSIFRTSLKRHFHTGIKTGIEVIPIPPYVLPVISPVVAYSAIDSLSYSEQSNPISMKNHKHSIIGLPSFSVGESVQMRISNELGGHGHSITGVSVDVGALSITEIFLNPPPLYVV